MRIDITIHDMDDPTMSAEQTLLVRGLAGDRDSIVLDAVGLQIDRVAVDGVATGFEADGRRLRIEFPGRPLRRGEERQIQIGYRGSYQVSDGLGLNWSVGDPDGDSETDRYSQIHTQGQAENNSRWFPCHDSPNQRLSTELLVRVPEPYTVISNGRLVSRGPSEAGLVSWHYLQERPHPAYLVTLVVGVFEEVRLSGPGIEGPTQIPMSVYGPVGTGRNMRRVFEGTPAMMEFFERWIGEPYPWDRYDQVCVRNFHSGGMENTAATTLYEQAARSTRNREEDLIAHELAHMWFGDLVTCRSWDHLWLNEGWATYSEVLWREERARQEAIRDGLDDAAAEAEAERAMLEYMLQLVRVQRRFNRAHAPLDAALSSNLYEDPETTFERPDDPYNKGAAVLHMIRGALGDDLFQQAAREYVRRHRDGLVETDDLRRCIEDVSGRSFERFFAQWVYRPGLPRLDVSIEWDAHAGELAVQVEQQQRIDADNPAYHFHLPLEIRIGATSRTLMVPVRDRSTASRFALSQRPEQVAVDPRLTIFAATRVEKNLAWWIRELEDGPTVAARVLAAEAIGGLPDPHGALAAAAIDPAQPGAVRETAARGAAGWIARGLAVGYPQLVFGAGPTTVAAGSVAAPGAFASGRGEEDPS